MSDGDALLRACFRAPDDEAPRLILADWCDEHGQNTEATVLRAGNHLVDTATRVAVDCLSGCRFLPGSWAKRFVREMDAICGDSEYGPPEMTTKQLFYVWLLTWKYRRQLPHVRRDLLLQRCRELGVLEIEAGNKVR